MELTNIGKHLTNLKVNLFLDPEVRIYHTCNQHIPVNLILTISQITLYFSCAKENG